VEVDWLGGRHQLLLLKEVVMLRLLMMRLLGRWLRNEDHRPVQLVHLLPKQVHVGVQKALFALRQATLTIHLVAQPTHPVGKQRHLASKKKKKKKKKQSKKSW